jgi:hypothetical protein
MSGSGDRGEETPSESRQGDQASYHLAAATGAGGVDGSGGGEDASGTAVVPSDGSTGGSQSPSSSMLRRSSSRKSDGTPEKTVVETLL